ncbi:MAG: hypothetical protein AAFQ64_00615 [Pseudomonadota bacterium]
MRSALTILLVLGAGTAQAQAWGDEAGCQRVRGEQVLTDSVFILWPDRIERHESNCQIKEIDGDINLRAVITVECSGEGETWDDQYGITPVGDDFAIWPVGSPEFITELRPCE